MGNGPACLSEWMPRDQGGVEFILYASWQHQHQEQYNEGDQS